MKKFAAIVGTILICVGVIFSTIFWIVIIDSGSVAGMKIMRPDDTIVAMIGPLGSPKGKWPILVGIPVTIYGFFTKFSYRMAFLTGFLSLLAYGIFWLIIAFTAAD